MAVLIFPLSADGLTVPVVIGVGASAMATCLAAGQPIPAPVTCKGLIDTGCTVTAVRTPVLQQLPLLPTITTTTQTAGGPVDVDVYEISLSVVGSGAAGGPTLVQPAMLVSELQTPLGDVDVLLGLDVLLGCRFVLDGPVRQFTLEF
jgi:hypothetical protein